MVNILVVDDDIMCLEFVKIFLEGEGHNVSAAQDLQAVYAYAKESTPDVLVTDLNLGDESGESAVDYIKTINPEIKVIVVTGYDKGHLSDLKINYNAFLKKPIDLDELQVAVQKLA